MNYLEPSDGLAPKNYRIKGYQPLVDDHTDIIDRFEQKDKENKAQFETKAV